MGMTDLTKRYKKVHEGQFPKGVSGNPGGRPKIPENVRDLARSYTEVAIETLADIAQNTRATPTARIQASTAILDRAWGKPTQQVEQVSMKLSYTEFLEKMVEEEEAAGTLYTDFDESLMDL